MDKIADQLAVPPNISIPLAEMEFTFVRSAGPRGQNVNKVNSKAVLRWPVIASPSLAAGVKNRFRATYSSRLTNEGELILTSQRFRDQASNRADCLEKLSEMLAAVARPPKIRKRTRPTLGSQRRRLEEKRRHSQNKSSRRPPPES